MTGDVLPFLVAIACVFLTSGAALPSKTGNSKLSRDISHTDLERLILNTIETVKTQAFNRADDKETANTPWDNENAPTLPDVIKDWTERRQHLAGNKLLKEFNGDDAIDILDKRSNDYRWGMTFGKRSQLSDRQREQDFKLETKKSNDDLYGMGFLFGKRDNPTYGWGNIFGKRDGEEGDYDDFVAL